MQKLPVPFAAIASFAGIVAFILLFWISVYGPGVSPDSIVYLETAVNVVSGEGFYANSEPMTHYPPVYPLMLALSSLMGSDILATSRVLHATIFGMNAILVTTAVYLYSNRQRLLAAGCAFFLFMISTPILTVHAWAWSDPPFIMYSVTSLILLTFYLTNSSWYWLIGAAFFMGLAMATRYIGIVLFVPLLFGLIVLNTRNVIERGRDALVAMAIASIPIGLWFGRNLMVADTVTNRQLVIHPFGLTHLKALIGTLSDFVLPIALPFWAKALHTAVWLLLLLIVLKMYYRSYVPIEANSQAGMVFVSLNLVFILSYLAFLIVSISFIDAYTPLDNRILLPVSISLIMIIVVTAASVLHEQHQAAVRLSLFFFVALSLSLNGIYIAQEARNIHRYGLGFTSQLWRNSETITAVSALASDTLIFSNGPDVLRFWTGKDARLLPYRLFPTTLQLNEDYETQLKATCSGFSDGKLIVVYFDTIIRGYLLTKDEFTSTCNGIVGHRFADGSVYGRN
ncbi:MAG: glycosyltransferase family 39 protein [Chloroflexi bacterium]|nr:glycosyltransferase family 39 protein [Chloroflexota bacterium]